MKNPVMKKTLLLAFAALCFVQSALAWGKSGHKSMYSNISSYIDSAKNALANITVTISEEARDNIKEDIAHLFVTS